MSHTSVLRGVKLSSRAFLEEAVEALITEGIKCRLTPNLAPRMYYDQGAGRGHQFRENSQRLFGRKLETADLCLELLDGPYDVGFVWNEKEESYEPVFDSYNRNVCKYIGSRNKKDAQGGMDGKLGDIGKLLQEYSRVQITKTLVDQGFTVQSCEMNQETGAFDVVYVG